MRTTHRSDVARVARMGEPVMHGRANPTALDWRLACPGMARNQQKDAVALRNSSLKPLVDRVPGTIQIMAVKVENAVGLKRTLCDLPVPAAVQRGTRAWRRRRRRGSDRG